MPSETHRETHRETEIKLAVKDLPGLIDRLRGLGVRSRGRVLERNTLFDTDDSDLRTRGRMLRLRLETPAPAPFARGRPERMLLTAKAPPPGESGAVKEAKGRPGGSRRGQSSRYKENLEREVALTEPSRRAPRAERTPRDRGWAFAMGCLGLRTKFRYEKFRTSFRMQGVHLDLDETPVGTFLELEGRPAAIDRVARELGFTPSEYIRATYYEIYVAERRRRGRPVRHMLFSRSAR
jgi:adenylate cyclase class 2